MNMNLDLVARVTCVANVCDWKLQFLHLLTWWYSNHFAPSPSSFPIFITRHTALRIRKETKTQAELWPFQPVIVTLCELSYVLENGSCCFVVRLLHHICSCTLTDRHFTELQGLKSTEKHLNLDIQTLRFHFCITNHGWPELSFKSAVKVMGRLDTYCQRWNQTSITEIVLHHWKIKFYYNNSRNENVHYHSFLCRHETENFALYTVLEELKTRSTKKYEILKGSGPIEKYAATSVIY